MRVTTKKWIACGFDLSKHEALSGLLDACHTIAIIPRSNEAKTDAMMNHGFITEEEKNAWAYDETMNTLGSINAKILNQYCKETSGMLTFAGTDYCSVLLKSFTKKYNRADDVFSILYGKRDGPLRFITPCGDWWILTAPRIGDTDECEGIPIRLDPFPMEVLQ